MLIDYSKNRADAISSDVDLFPGVSSRQSRNGSSIGPSGRVVGETEPERGGNRSRSRVSRTKSDEGRSKDGEGKNSQRFRASTRGKSVDTAPSFTTTLSNDKDRISCKSCNSEAQQCSSSATDESHGRNPLLFKNTAQGAETARVEDASPVIGTLPIKSKSSVLKKLNKCDTSALVQEHRNRRPTTLIEMDGYEDSEGVTLDISEMKVDDESVASEQSLALSVILAADDPDPLRIGKRCSSNNNLRDKSQQQTRDWSKPSRQTVDWNNKSSKSCRRTGKGMPKKWNSFTSSPTQIKDVGEIELENETNDRKVLVEKLLRESASMSNLGSNKSNNHGDAQSPGVSFSVRRRGLPPRSRTYDEGLSNSKNRFEQSLSSLISYSGTHCVGGGDRDIAKTGSANMPNARPNRPPISKMGPRQQPELPDAIKKLNMSMSCLNAVAQSPSLNATATSRSFGQLSTESDFGNISKSSLVDKVPSKKNRNQRENDSHCDTHSSTHSLSPTDSLSLKVSCSPKNDRTNTPIPKIIFDIPILPDRKERPVPDRPRRRRRPQRCSSLQETDVLGYGDEGELAERHSNSSSARPARSASMDHTFVDSRRQHRAIDNLAFFQFQQERRSSIDSLQSETSMVSAQEQQQQQKQPLQQQHSRRNLMSHHGKSKDASHFVTGSRIRRIGPSHRFKG